MNYNVYFFDIQNKADVTFNASTPTVTEVGPYAYDENFQKFDISWEDDGNIVTYQTWKYYTFNQENTNAGLGEDDEITLPYLPAVGFEYLFQQVPPELTAALAQAEQVSVLYAVLLSTRQFNILIYISKHAI